MLRQVMRMLMLMWMATVDESIVSNNVCGYGKESKRNESNRIESN